MVPIKELFADAQSPAEVASRFEAFKGALDASAHQQAAAKAAGISFISDPDHGPNWIRPEGNASADALATLGKSVSPDILASLTEELNKNGTLNKDLSLTSPISTGLVPYDLEAPAKFLVPVRTPLRNRIPRIKGQGTSRRFKQITGISNSGTGGVANLSPFINDASTMTSGSLTLRRGAKISYAGADKNVNYKQMGLSDVATWSAQFAGQGFGDARQLSHTAVLYASMLADEMALLGARGTDAGVFVGQLGTPAGGSVVLTARVAAGTEVGNSANIATLYVRVAAEGLFGESIASAEVTTTALAAVTGRVVDVTMTGAFVTGATGFKIYVGTATAIANQFYSGRTGAWGGTAGAATAAYTIQFTGAGTGGAPSTGDNGLAAATAATADQYDGLLTVLTDPLQSGAIFSNGGLALSTGTPGLELQNVFAALFSGVAPGNGYSGVLASGTSRGVKADPNRVLAAGQDRKQLSNTILAGSSGNPTFIMTVDVPDQAGMRMGTVVSGIVNQTTGRTVDVEVHPYLPQGTMLVCSDELPIPDSEVPSAFAYVLPQDYLGMDWPVIQHTFDVGSYWFGALVPYAPSFSGAVVNILPK